MIHLDLPWIFTFSLGLAALMALRLVCLRRQDELRQVMIHARTIFETTGTAMLISEADTTIAQINNEFEVLSGYPRDEVEGKKCWTEFFHPAVRAEMLERHRLRRAYTFSAPRRYTSRFVDKTGQEHEVQVTVAMLPGTRRSVISLLDTSTLKQTERSLLRAEEDFRSLFENATEGIFQTSPAGRYLQVNPALSRIYGYASPEEMIARFTDIAHQLYVDPNRRAQFAALLEKDNDVTDFISLIYRKDGSKIWINENARAVRDSAGRLLYYEGMVVDITARVEAEQALKVQNARLEEALAELKAAQFRLIEQERLRSLGQMASGIAHDFNNALSPITGFTEILLKKPEYLQNSAKAGHYLTLIHTAARDAAAIVRRLREIYRPRESSDVMRPIDLNRLVEQVLLLSRPKWKNQALAIGATIQVVTDLPPAPCVAGVETDLREVLMNLIFNAVDAMPHGGTLTLRTREDKGFVALAIGDTGVGMPSEVQRRCFEPFFTTKGENGSGLGLAMVFSIIKRHEGTVGVSSTPGVGTTFTLGLPIAKEAAGAERDVKPPSPGTTLHALMMDDDQNVLEVIKEYLLSEGIDVDTATNGQDGLKMFEHKRYDLVLTDRGMPNMGGDQIAQLIRHMDAAIPIIMLTGFADAMETSGIHPAGVDYLVSKPVTLDDLQTVLAKVRNHTQPEPRCTSGTMPA